MTDRLGGVTLNVVELGILDGRRVGVRVRLPEVERLLPDVEVMLRLSPAEARSLAAALLRKAKEAEGATAPTLQ